MTIRKSIIMSIFLLTSSIFIQGREPDLDAHEEETLDFITAHNLDTNESDEMMPGLPEPNEDAESEQIIDSPEDEEDSEDDSQYAQPRRINQIIIIGNERTSQSALLKYIPYKIGEVFDQYKTGELIRNLYFGLKRFRNVSVKTENIGTDLLDLYIIVEEKLVIKDVLFTGNTHIPEKDLRKAINIADVPALDAEELKILAQKIRKEYMDKSYCMTTVNTKLDIDDDGKALATFEIVEGKKSIVKCICFKGNCTIPSKELRSIMITREEWALGFLDGSGTYQAERLEADKHFISRYYQNKGFLQAKVTNVITETDPRTKKITLTYEIEEGCRYIIKEIHAPGNELICEEALLARIPIRPGDYYSPDRIADALKILERIWGNQGYIFAHIDPSIEPDDDSKTVNLSFYSELGNKIYLNKITVKGNKKSRDKIIRRRINLREGELITQSQMDTSKQGVESLGFFDPRDGVNWKLTRLGSDLADLDLILKEVKTGNFNVQMGWGGMDLSSPVAGLTVKGNLSDTNLFGSGIYLNLQGSWAKEEQTFAFHLAQPWLFDKPISVAMDLYHRRPSYDQFRHIAPPTIFGKLTGGGLTGGFITRATNPILSNTQVLFMTGIDNIKYETMPTANIAGFPMVINHEFQCILNKEFTSGSFGWVANNIEQDHRNHPMHTSRGHKWLWQTKVAFPAFGNNIGFFKSTFDSHWFTPVINEYDLVFHLHAFAGFIHVFNDHTIPYPELFNIGGQASVRGFLFGQIGPRFADDPIGASKALFINAELGFPITPDFNLKGVVFYDGGAGFGNPFVHDCVHACQEPRPAIRGNNFDYRHSVGIGIRMLNPMPVRIDWGFKLDPRKNESASEVHFGMTYDW
jgi:outer membrane protein insertion porin family